MPKIANALQTIKGLIVIEYFQKKYCICAVAAKCFLRVHKKNNNMVRDHTFMTSSRNWGRGGVLIIFFYVLVDSGVFKQ